MMKNRAIPWAIGLALVLLLVSVGVSFAQTPQPSDDQVNAVAKELYCPVCENIPLDVCPTQACSQWRDLIRQKLADGWSKDQIKQYFKLQYGDRVLAEPPREGLNWMVYVLPPIFFLAGAYLVYRVIANRKPLPSTPSSPAAVPSKPANDPYLKRLEEELKKRE
jgi:cytochrome c-type biogenesis protein CcmH